MRIAIAAEPIKDGAGLGTFVFDAVRILSKVRPNWEFFVVVSSWYTEIQRLLNLDNVNIYVWDYAGLRKTIMDKTPNFRGRFRLLNCIAKFAPSQKLRLSLGNLTKLWKSLPDFDVLWVPYFDNNRSDWPALSQPDLIKCPVLLTIHDLHPIFFPRSWKKNGRALKNFNERFIPFAQRSQCIITHSHFQKSSIAKYLKIPPEKISVAFIPMSVDEDLYKLHSEKKCRNLLEKFRISKPYGFSPLSQTLEHKNHDRLLQAWHLLKRKLGKKCPMLVFTIKGDKQRQKKFLKRIRSLGIEDKIVFTGMVERSELAILYHESEFVIFPSLYEGGGGYPVLEGCAVGKPVLCSRIPPIVEQVQRFKLAVSLFDPRDNSSIIEVIEKAFQNSIKRAPQINRIPIQNLEIEWVEFAELYASQIESIVGR